MTNTDELTDLLQNVRRQLAELTARVARLEGVGQTAVSQPPAQPEAQPETPELTEEEILAMSAGIAAYLGVKVRIKQIRLIRSSAWSQVGRVSIQASHRLHP
jgi:methylmalonyl-CoA carboxyltransferase 12S subunit